MEEHTHENKHEHKVEEVPKKEEGGEITLKKDTLWKGATALFAVLFVISLFTGGFGMGSGDGVTGNAINPPPSAAQDVPAPTPAAVKVEIGDDDILGDPDAPVTIIEFSDYECPFCKRFRDNTFDQLKAEYIDTGKVKLAYRDFPLSIHPQAQKAAEAAECAGEQGKYWEMHDKIFEGSQGMGIDALKSYAGQIGINSGTFNECLDSGAMASEVQTDFSEGQAAGVRGTPAFFINGKLVSGAQPFSVFQQAIEAELA